MRVTSDSIYFGKYNQIGRVVQITSQAGVEQRQYGKLGEVVQETRTVNSHTQGNITSDLAAVSGQPSRMASSPISANSPEVYTTGYGFDTFGRLMTLTQKSIGGMYGGICLKTL
jgi:hypothetical protein